jgi:hypothetical protein
MAIRTDFTAGEVLAAADLNDTFASKPPFAYGTATPTTTVEGFIWYDENSTPPEPKFWDGAAFQAVSAPGGLVHITTESFSAVSSVSVNNCFTSTYANYKILMNWTASTDAALNLRLRASGTDNSANSYTRQRTISSSTTVSGARNTDTVFLFAISQSGSNNLSADIFSPQLAANTSYNLISNYSDSIAATVITTGVHEVASAFDGFSILAGTGTITGTFRVYGYLNS